MRVLAVGTEDGVAKERNGEGRTCKSWWLIGSVGKEAFMFIECQPHVGPCAGEIKLSLVEELGL